MFTQLFPSVLWSKNSHHFAQLAFTNFPNFLFPGSGTKAASLFHHGTTIRPSSSVYRSSKSSYSYWCALEIISTDAFVSVKQFLGPLRPSRLLSSCLGLPQLWLNVDFPLNGEVPQSRWDSQRNECESPVVRSIEKISHGTNRGTTNFFPWTTSSLNLVLTLQRKKTQKASIEKYVQESRQSSRGYRDRSGSRDKEHHACGQGITSKHWVWENCWASGSLTPIKADEKPNSSLSHWGSREKSWNSQESWKKESWPR